MKIGERLKLNLELKEKIAKLTEYRAEFENQNKRFSELERGLDEATTEEEMGIVKRSLDELEKEVAEKDLETKITEAEAEVAEIEAKLEKDIEEPVEEPVEERGGCKGMITRGRTREMLRTGEYYETAEVRSFYESFKNLRTVGGEGLTIPQIIVNRIMDIVGDYTTVYPLVNVISVNGTARILIDTDTDAATWVEMSASIPTGDVGTITNIDFDGYKLGKVTFVDNNILEDSIINVDDYVCRKIARAIAKGLDKAIIKGTGATNKQPTGIITSLDSSHKVDVTKGPKALIDTVKQISLIDTGADSVGTITAVMSRKTYYDIFFEYSVQVNSAGNVVGKLPNLSQPDLLGLPVVFNNNVDDDKVLFGAFENYTLVERGSITIDNSPHVKFVEDQMAFRGKGRFDGKPTKASAFVLVSLVDPVVEAGE